jgi:cytochrome P450
MATGHAPVSLVADGKYLVTGFTEALVALSDEHLSNDPANSAHLHEDIARHAELGQRRGTSMERCDAPQHTRLRRAVAAALSQRSYAGQLDQMKQRAENLFGAVLTRGDGDLVADFILPVVFGVIRSPRHSGG